MHDKVERLEGMFKGLHIVINAMADELRQQNPELAIKVAGKISDWALDPASSEHIEEMVKVYISVLKHGSKTDGTKLQ